MYVFVIYCTIFTREDIIREKSYYYYDATEEKMINMIMMNVVHCSML